MNRARRPPLQHPLALVFDRAVYSVSGALSPDTIRHYRGTARNFLRFLGLAYPQVNGLEQLRREPHILGWMYHLRSKVRALSTASYINQLISLHCLFNELALSIKHAVLDRLIRREDFPCQQQQLT